MTPTPRSPRGPLVTEWTGAGVRAGASLGAMLGGALVLLGTLDSDALLAVDDQAPILSVLLTVVAGMLAGVLAGGALGLVVGVLNGTVLALLVRTPVLRPGAANQRRRATLAAIATTVSGTLVAQHSLFGWIPDLGSRWLLTYVPVATGALMAAALSRRLPPTGQARQPESRTGH